MTTGHKLTGACVYSAVGATAQADREIQSLPGTHWAIMFDDDGEVSGALHSTHLAECS